MTPRILKDVSRIHHQLAVEETKTTVTCMLGSMKMISVNITLNERLMLFTSADNESTFCRHDQVCVIAEINQVVSVSHYTLSSPAWTQNYDGPMPELFTVLSSVGFIVSDGHFQLQ